MRFHHPRALRAPDHGRPYDWPHREDDPPPTPPDLTVYPSEELDEVDEPALYGPGGEPLRWRAQRPVGFRRLTEDDL